jgi:maltooligosyltrehalose trehalohydrolase
MTERRFSVWAPTAATVDLVTGAESMAMRADGFGWFICDVDVAVSEEYAFRVDGSDPMPDPRSRSQPAGVHGPSRVVVSTPRPVDAQWRGFAFADAIIYELHIGTFTAEGTFDGAITRLEHLQQLGINAIEIMPVAQFPGRRGWGYDGVDLFAPHSAYGGPEGLVRLVRACHARGIAVIVDVVYNHLGPEGDYLGAFGPYFTERYNTPWGSAFNYDGENSDEVRRFVLDNAEMWLRDYGCDGLRLDAVHAIIDTSPTHILEAIAVRVDQLAHELDRDLWVIAESDANDPRLVRDRALGGYGLTAQWNDDLHHALHALLTGERHGYYEDFGEPEEVITGLRDVFVYGGRFSRHRKRTVGRHPGDLPRTRFVTYSQNHDQVGNRATGERLSHLVSDGRARMAAALTLLSPMVPMLFQGEEWAASTPFQYFTDLGDEHLRKAVTNGRRREFRAFGWAPESVPDPQAPETFQRSKLDWDETGDPIHREMLDWYRALIQLRTQGREADLNDEPLDAEWDSTRELLLYAHRDLLVCCNLGDEIHELPEAAGKALVLSSAAAIAEGVLPLVPADSVSIWRAAGVK